jgi:uncharacterized membrane protein YcfT
MNEKMKSRRFWIVIWAMLYVSIMSGYAMATNNIHSWVVIGVVAGIIVSYMTISSLKKKKEGEE